MVNDITIQNVSLRFGTTKVFNDLNVQIKRGEFICVMGVNSGLGFRISEASEFLNYPKVYYLLIVIGIFALALNIAHSRFARRMLRWM